MHFLAAVILMCNQVVEITCMGRRRNNQNSCARQAFLQYQFLLLFCCNQLDALLEQEELMMFIHHDELPELINSVPINRVIDELSDDFANKMDSFH
jgi:hypothetical protein